MHEISYFFHNKYIDKKNIYGNITSMKIGRTLIRQLHFAFKVESLHSNFGNNMQKI